MEAKYDLEPFFNSIRDGSIFMGQKPTRVYHGLPNLIRKYRKKVEEVQTRPIYVMGEEGQVYENLVEFLTGGHYLVAWDINKATKIIQDFKIPVELGPLSGLLEYVDVESLEEEHLPTALHNNDPAILVQFAPLNTYFVIDGNHRIAAKHKVVPNGGFPYYVIPHPLHSAAMFSDLDRTLYAMHQNMTTILNYMLGNWDSLGKARKRGCMNGTEDLSWI